MLGRHGFPLAILDYGKNSRIFRIGILINPRANQPRIVMDTLPRSEYRNTVELHPAVPHAAPADYYSIGNYLGIING